MCWVKCVRPKTVLLAVLLLITSFKISSWDEMLWLLPLFVFVGGCSTMSINDWYDREHDAKKGKDFALRKNNIFFLFVVALWIISLALALLVWSKNEIYGLISFGLVFMGLFYSWSRKVFMLSAVWVGLAAGGATLFAVYAKPSKTTTLLFFSTVVFMIAREFLKDIDDIGIDKGYKNTLAVKVGASSTKVIAGLLTFLAFIAAVFITWKALIGAPFVVLSFILLVTNKDQKKAKHINDAMFGVILLILFFTGM